MCNSIIAGVDIGGSHITVALIDMDNGTVLNHTWKRFEVNAQGSANDIIDTWSNAIAESVKAHHESPVGLGIAMPGPFDYKEGISLMQNQNKYDALHGLNVKQLLSDQLAFDTDQVIMTNDAACFLKGEVFSGAAKGYNRVMGLTLGTGLGSSRCIKGEVEDANLWCSFFKEGIAEDYLSSRWFVKRYRELSGKAVKDVKQLVDTIPGDPLAQQVLDEFGYNLGSFLLPYILQDNIEVVVLGGNIANAFHLFSNALQNAINEKAAFVKLRPTSLGESATLIGAASYCLHHENVPMQSMDNK